MARIVGVHGIGNHDYVDRNGGAEAAAKTISRDWTDWLQGDSEVAVGYYSHLLHRGTPQGDVALLTPGEQELFVAFVDQLQPSPQAAQGQITARARQAGEWLTERYGEAARRLAAIFVREVHTYLHHADDSFRTAAREAVAAAIRDHRPEVVIAHSLGSVVAYEALWADPGLSVPTLITLGSPLGMNGVIFQRLRPAPEAGRGARPPGVKRWVNLADVGDLVAVPADLCSRFDGVEQSPPVRIARFDFHRVRAYLGCPDVRDLVSGDF
ncbi:hypothetical protein [Spongiactinospora sp. TRM90649]|uniref:hypothetical protein n=1 Tax=Spongiactinospora sp. TRM90649 TaxID=3031114 RepID=UPI0023F9139F|nr:hypothetical protein [Spongiactinospora sp. TRM90649]MDF5755741.1 hypothetical protein [Spongiactinospora sp. TRM90649]